MEIRSETAVHPLPDGEVRLLGAVHGVTGAMTRVELGGTRFLVDCGAPQGREGAGWTFPEAALAADAVILTHGHRDHVASLPELWRRGWSGPIHATAATLELARIVLDDGLELAGRRDERPAFLRWLKARARPLRYERLEAHLEGSPVRFGLHEAGHILGSASVELRHARSRVLCSGDLGRPGSPILRDPNRRWTADRPFDLVVLESTYGDRRHVDADLRARLLEVVRRAQARGGHILVPAFAIGRTQLLLYLLDELVESGAVQDLPVAVDTPMGLEVTETYRRFKRLYDRDALAQMAQGDDPLLFEDLYAVHKGRDSVRLRDIEGPILIIAGSGMCTGGRIVGHLRELLPRPETVVLFVGFQAPGTPGRAIQEAGPGGRVRLDGEEVRVRAHVETLSGLSAHADQGELCHWLAAVPDVRAVALHHGEPEAQRALRDRLRREGVRRPPAPPGPGRGGG